MAHLSSLGLENFRTFRERADFDFAPLTILTGPNSSGKSSIFKALLLLQENVRRGGLHQLDFTGGKHNLGSFGAMKSRASDQEKVTFEVTSYWEGSYRDEYQASEGWLDVSCEIGFVYYQISYGEVHGKTLLTDLRISIGEKDDVLLEAEMEAAQEGYDYQTTVNGEWLDEGVFSLDEIIYDTGEWGAEALRGFFQHQFENNFSEETPLTLGEIMDKATRPIRDRFFSLDEIGVRTSGGAQAFEKAIDTFFGEWPTFLRRVLSPGKMGHASASHAQPKRIYGASDEQRGFLACLSALAAERDYSDRVARVARVNRWLRALNMGEYLEVSQVAEGAFTVEVARDGNAYALADMGYGVTQLLPLILQTAFREHPTLLVEEPETNLHPNLQSKLGDLFVELTEENEHVETIRSHINVSHERAEFDERCAIVETHSEYLIRRLQQLVAEGDLDREKVVIYYLGDPEAEDYIRRIEITDSGQLSQSFGSGFLDEASNLMTNLYTYGSQN